MNQRFANIPFPPARFPVLYGWPVLMAGAMGLLMSVPGQAIGVSVFTDPLLEALGLTPSQLSTAYMFGAIGSACLLPWAGMAPGAAVKPAREPEGPLIGAAGPQEEYAQG